MNLIIEDINFRYKTKHILNNICLDIDFGNVVSIIGPNGCGKTTFIKCINKVLRPQSGKVLLNDEDLHLMKQKDIAKKIAYVPQMTNEFFSGSVIDLVLMGRRPYINWKVSDEDIKMVLDILDNMDIIHLADKRYSELSGGQKQKVLIARALAQDTDIYLLDEPTSFLDIKNQIEVMKMARELANQGKIVIIVVHDLNMAMKYSDKILLLEEGSVIASGKPNEVLTEENIKKVYDVDIDIVNNHIIAV
jgi:iron complex transport system ATP-binding protein